MKMKDKEQIIFTPGLDSRSLKMDYYDIDNMVIVGTTGSGKTTALNAIVKSMIESNSSEYLQLVMFDGTNNTNESPFFNQTRITPFNELQRNLGFVKGMFYHRVFCLVENLSRVVCTCCSDLGEVSDFVDRNKSVHVPGTIVVVINNFDALPKYIQLYVWYIMMWESSQVKFILTGQSERPFKDYIDSVRYRLITRADDNASNILLGCNIASRRADKYGSCWFYDINEPDTYTKHIVNFTPDSLLNRMMKSYASGKPSNNRLLKKYYSVGAIDYSEHSCDMREIISDMFKVDGKALYEEFIKIANEEVDRHQSSTSDKIKEKAQCIDSTSEEIEEGTV